MKGQDILEGASLYNEILYYEILFSEKLYIEKSVLFSKKNSDKV